MTDIYVSCPDILRLLSDVEINSFNGFGKNMAKQLICCRYYDYVIGDMILFGREDDNVETVGPPPVANWVQFHAESGKYDVKVERREHSASNRKPRKTYRYALQGLKAWDLLAKLDGAPLGDIERDERAAVRSDPEKPHVVSVPAAGPECDEDAGICYGRDAARLQILPHENDRDRWKAGSRAAPRYDRAAELRSVRLVGGR